MNRNKQSAKRIFTDVWYPKACELPLAHIPEKDRKEIRKRLAPWLRNLTDIYNNRIPVKRGDCWHVAQALVYTANDPDVVYVEGVWSRSLDADSEYLDGDDLEPGAHAWVMVDGYRVDLIEELFSWRSYGADSKWVHEPLKSYSRDELLYAALIETWVMYTAEVDADNRIPFETWLKSPVRPKDDETLCDISSIYDWTENKDGIKEQQEVFEPAAKRLTERMNQEVAA